MVDASPTGCLEAECAELRARVAALEADRLTCRAHHEQQLATLGAESRLWREIVESAHEGIVVYGADLRYRVWNPYLETVTGKHRNEVVGKHPLEVFPGLAEARIIERIERALRGESPGPFELPYEIDGKQKWFVDTSAPLRDEAGRTIGVLATVQEVTARVLADKALRESEARFRDIAHAQQGLVWEADRELRLTHLSGRVREVLGCESDELLGTAPAFLSEAKAPLSALLARPAPRDGEHPVEASESWVCTKDGRQVRLAWRAVPIAGPAGETAGLRGSHVDITEVYWSRRLRELLLALHERSDRPDGEINALLCEALSQLTQSPLSFFGMIEPDGSAMVCHVWSPAADEACRVTERPLRFPIATAGLWAEPIRERRPVVINDYAAAPGRRGLPTGHLPLTRYLGVPIVVDGAVVALAGLANRATPYTDDDVTHVRNVGAGIADLLKARATERALRNERERLRTILDTVGDPIFVKDDAHRITVANRAFDRMFELGEGFAIGKTLTEHVPPDEREAFLAVDRQVLDTGVPDVREESLTVRGGATRSIVTTKVRLLDDAGARFLVGTVHDITESKRQEHERAKLQEQLHQAQKLEAIGTLAGGVAHDFNNILGGVMTGLSLLELELGAGAERHRADLQAMRELVQRGASLVKQLLGLGRRGKYDVAPCDLREIVRETVELFGRTRRDITISLELSVDLDRALVDHAQIEQVLLNLFINAGQAMPAGGRLSIRAENATLSAAEATPHGAAPGRFVKLVVKDCGTGIAPEALPRIFDPFFTTKSPGAGTGLGLASAYGIVKNHGGLIEVESELGQGTAFTILLPATLRPPLGERATVPAPTPGAVAKGLVLLVDDEAALLTLGARALRAMGYQVLTASRGAAAVDLVRQHGHELSAVILDLTMPEMSGAKTFDALRAIAPSLKVLLASGFAVDGQAQALLDRGCNGFIQKPFTLAALAAKLEALG